ncbi:hypothetical protein MP228_008365 [Amoeboaphelidium protococcarum]|nr:hypothetical protein MP228_008365 [Amoeboaphelidium protococcarum]
MTVYSIFIFNRHCACIYQHIFATGSGNGSQRENSSDMTWQESSKLIYGVIFTLNNITSKLALNNTGSNTLVFKTATYKLHALATATNLRLVLFTSPDVQSQDGLDLLTRFHQQVYCPYVISNPLIRGELSTLDKQQGGYEDYGILDFVPYADAAPQSIHIKESSADKKRRLLKRYEVIGLNDNEVFKTKVDQFLKSGSVL